MAKARKGGKSSAASFVRSLTGESAKDTPAERGERAANGLVKSRDPDQVRLVIPFGGSITLTRPIPQAKRELLARIKGLGPREAWVQKVREWNDNGTLDGIWEKMARLALNGDKEAIKEIMNRTLGTSTQNIAIAAEIRHTFTPEDKAVINGMRALFGMDTAGPVEPPIDVEAKEVA